jgi:peptide/nickel transport system permease protein
MPRSVLWLLLWCSLVVLAPALAPRDPLAIDSEALSSASSAHWLGTDSLGRDVLSRLLYGGRLTVAMGAAGAGTAAILGTLLGLAAALAPPLVQRLAALVMTVLASLPALVIALTAVTLLGQGFLQIALAVGIAQAPPIALFTSEVSRARLGELYVLSARASGAGGWGIAIRHIWPNIRSLWFSYVVILFAQSIMNTAALSFLGLSGDLSAPEWGSMLAEARQVIRAAPGLGIYPGAAIAVTILLANRAAVSLSREPR